MPFTVITIKNVPLSLRGDLTKWMQEIATGVYVGNFNVKVREELWDRVRESVGVGEATLSFAYRNEIGFNFQTLNTMRNMVDFEGIPLVQYSLEEQNVNIVETQKGYSNAAKMRKIKSIHSLAPSKKIEHNGYVILDIETDGLEPKKNSIIEIGALKIIGKEIQEINCLLTCDSKLPSEIIKLTGITDEMLDNSGMPLKNALVLLLDFIRDFPLIGYNIDFDIRFLNTKLKENGLSLIQNKCIDLMNLIKKEKMYLKNYRLQTSLSAYGIDEMVPHRALLDCNLIHNLYLKVNKV